MGHTLWLKAKTKGRPIMRDHINEEWIRKVLHSRNDRERFADALSGYDARISRDAEDSESDSKENSGKEPCFYVYGLFDKTAWDNGILIPFYIGKGKGQRVFSHAAEAIQYWKDELGDNKLTPELEEELRSIEMANIDNDNLLERPSDEQEGIQAKKKQEKRAKCERILDCKDGIVEGVFKFGLYENEAFWVEDALIKAYNLIKAHLPKKKTNLSGNFLTNAVSGHRTPYEKLTIESSIDSIQTLEDVLHSIAAEPICFKDIREKLAANSLLVFKIEEADYIAMQDKIKDKRKWLIDRSRGYWDLKPRNDEFAVVLLKGSGRILAVYEIKPFVQSGKLWIDLKTPADDVSEEEYANAPWHGTDEYAHAFKEALKELYRATSDKQKKTILEKLKEESKIDLVNRKHTKFYYFEPAEIADDFIGKCAVVLVSEAGIRKDTARAVSRWDKKVEDAWSRAYEALGDRLFDEDTITNQTNKPKLHLKTISKAEEERVKHLRGKCEKDTGKLGKYLVDFSEG